MNTKIKQAWSAVDSIRARDAAWNRSGQRRVSNASQAAHDRRALLHILDLRRNVDVVLDAKEEQFLVYVDKCAFVPPDGEALISKVMRMWVRHLWSELKLRSPDVLPPVAGADDDGNMVLRWVGEDSIISVDVLRDGTLEWFHVVSTQPGVDEPPWAVGLHVGDPVNGDVVQRVPCR
jgi:hypothetical protein